MSAHVIDPPLGESASIFLIVNVVRDSCRRIIGTSRARALANACEVSRASVQPKREVFGVNVVGESLHATRKQVPVRLQVSSGVSTAIVPSFVHSTCPAIVQVEVSLWSTSVGSEQCIFAWKAEEGAIDLMDSVIK